MRETFESEADTLVRSRNMIADAIMRELSKAPPPRLSLSLPLPSPPPNVFLMPPVAGDPPSPWARSQKQVPTVVVPKRKVKVAARRAAHRTKLHWAVLAMAVAIGVALWLDPPARANANAQLRGATHHLLAKLPLALPGR
jgi:hypothetical protein